MMLQPSTTSAVDGISVSRIAAPPDAFEPKKNVPVEQCFWVLARSHNNSYMCKSCGEKKTCSSSRAIHHLVGPARGWALCRSPNPEYVAYLKGILEKRSSKKIHSSGRSALRRLQEEGVEGVEAYRVARAPKRVRDVESGASDDSADTAQQGVDGQPILTQSLRRRKNGRATAAVSTALAAIAEIRPIPESAERSKMEMGALYNAMDPGLVEARARARDYMHVYNNSSERDKGKCASALRGLLPNAGADLTVQAPFFCDYGSNIITGPGVFMNFNCVILDVCPVRIGARTMLGPSVQVYTAMHPISAKERAEGLEFGKPITIGADVWVGGAAVICPGVTIGDKTVIGAGSVVTKDLPPNVFAAGNPCRVIREIAENSANGTSNGPTAVTEI